MKQIQEIFDYCSDFYRPEEYPALKQQWNDWTDVQPMKDIRILDATPLFTNTLMKFIPLLAAGAELTAATHDLIPYDPNILPLLDKWEIPHVHNAGTGNFDCILDCGGVHSMLTPEYGFVELTRSGFYHYSNADKPVIFVDDSRIKAIETCLGTGDGFLRGMRHFGYNDFSGRNIVIFGGGKVGRGIAFYANKAGAKVFIIDDPGISVQPGIRFIDMHRQKDVEEAVRKAWCVVTATGIKGAMKGNGAAEILKDSTQIVAAMGIEDEWDGALPCRRILNNGTALNFALNEPTQLRYIDPTMSLSNAAALELVSKKLPAGIQKMDLQIEDYYWKAVEKDGVISQDLKDSGL